MNQQPPSKAGAIAGIAALSLALSAAVVLGFFGASPEGYQLSDRLVDLELVETNEGLRIDQDRSEQSQDLVTPDQFLAEVAERKQDRVGGPIRRILDITSVTGFLWVAFGLTAQGLFTARMLIQWLASEKAKASTVPVSFWWLSMIGASMLLAYFAWRRDIVGVIGQSTGWLVYLRNLWLIYKTRHAAQPAGETTDD